MPDTVGSPTHTTFFALTNDNKFIASYTWSSFGFLNMKKNLCPCQKKFFVNTPNVFTHRRKCPKILHLLWHYILYCNTVIKIYYRTKKKVWSMYLKTAAVDVLGVMLEHWLFIPHFHWVVRHGLVRFCTLYYDQESASTTSWTFTGKPGLNPKAYCGIKHAALVCLVLVTSRDIFLSPSQWTVLYDASSSILTMPYQLQLHTTWNHPGGVQNHPR